MSLGSNCGDRDVNIRKGLEYIHSLLTDVVSSNIYETPCARGNGSPYKNLVVRGKWHGDPDSLDSLLKGYEIEAGRNEECRKLGKVPIDIDIVIAEGKIVRKWDYRQKFFRKGYSEITQ